MLAFSKEEGAMPSLVGKVVTPIKAVVHAFDGTAQIRKGTTTTIETAWRCGGQVFLRLSGNGNARFVATDFDEIAS